jgi:hypothetical protein
MRLVSDRVWVSLIAIGEFNHVSSEFNHVYVSLIT